MISNSGFEVRQRPGWWGEEEGRGNHLWLERASKGVTGRDERRHRMSNDEKVRKAVTQQNL